jgi:hypothetical protein
MWTEPDGLDEHLAACARAARIAVETEDLLPAIRREWLNSALWGATNFRQKYDQRYRSASVEDGAPRPTWRHEHVVPRRWMADSIRKHLERERDIIALAVACVITTEEHAALTAFDRSHFGWDRYLAAGVTNGPTESMNNLAKRIKRVAFGMTSFRNWRIRVLLYAGRPDWSMLPTITPLPC